MTRTIAMVLALAGTFASGTVIQLSTISATGDAEVAMNELVGASTSRCLEVDDASEGDVAVVNITNTGATGGGWGALRSSEATPVFDRPVADQYASVNFAANTPPNPNLAFGKVGTLSEFCYDGAVFSHDVILDLAATIPGAFIDAIDPTRILDTRSGAPLSASSSECLEVASNPGDVAVVNITNTNAAGGGWGALRSSDDAPVFDRPVEDQYASVNFAASTPPNPNLAFSKIGSDNQFCYDGAVNDHDVILDLVATIPWTNINAIEPSRLYDSRDSSLLAEYSSECFDVPASNPGDVAVVNITNTNAAGGGWGALRSSDDAPVFDRPVEDQYASVNFAASTPPNPNLAFSKIGSDSMFCYDGAVSDHDVIIDLIAFFPSETVNAIDPTRILDTRSEGPPNPGDTKDCADFATYAGAKVWFDTYFPLYGDVAKLDADDDGEPCETLPGGPS